MVYHGAGASAASIRRAPQPIVKGSEVLGIATDPIFNRDSCNSVRLQGRTFWTCRDTQFLNEFGDPQGGIISSTAGWSQIEASGRPVIQDFSNGSGRGLIMTGTNSLSPYFPLQPGQCNDNSAGQCADRTRYAIWPDSPPLVSNGKDSGDFVGYTWIVNSLISPELSPVIKDPTVSLYRLTHSAGNPDQNALPAVNLVDGAFWPEDSIPFGAYGHIVRDGTAYLYGKASNGHIALAKAPIGSVEDKSTYQYWTGGSWSNTPPAIDDPSASIPNASAGGQGTYYFSDAWQSYVWIGQAALSVSAQFFITTAPEPTGPWEAPVEFYRGEDGSAALAAYSLQAHPDMVPAGANEIYLTYTKTDRRDTTIFDIYSTPLIRVEWQ